MLNNDLPFPTKDICDLILWIWEYVTFHGKRNFADVTKLSVLGWGDYLG